MDGNAAAHSGTLLIMSEAAVQERLKYAGKWIAWSADQSHVLFVGDSWAEIMDDVDAQNLCPNEYQIEFIPPRDTVVTPLRRYTAK